MLYSYAVRGTLYALRTMSTLISIIKSLLCLTFSTLLSFTFLIFTSNGTHLSVVLRLFCTFMTVLSAVFLFASSSSENGKPIIKMKKKKKKWFRCECICLKLITMFMTDSSHLKIFAIANKSFCVSINVISTYGNTSNTQIFLKIN